MDREAWCGYSPWDLKRLGRDLETKPQQHKTLMNKIKEELKKQRDSLCLYTRRLHIVKMPVLFNLTQTINVFSIEIPNCFVDINKMTLKCITRAKDPEKSDNI